MHRNDEPTGSPGDALIARLLAVAGSASDAIVGIDDDRRIDLFNPAAERVFGRQAIHVQGQPLSVLLPAPVLATLCSRFGDLVASGDAQRLWNLGPLEGLHADGRRLELEGLVMRAPGAKRSALTALLRDVGERGRAERALLHYQSELSLLAQHLLAQEQQTTRRLAQALHDDLGQTLAALRLSFDALRLALPPMDMASPLDRVEGLIADANRQVRSVLSDLRPPLLEEQGLAAALAGELALHRQACGPVTLDLAVEPQVAALRWRDAVEHAAFTVAREAVRNALQHAHARTITVGLQGSATGLQLQVQDDGVGLSDAQRAGKPGHLGLVGMRERALGIRAALDIRAAPGSGTTVRLAWVADHDAPVPDR